MGLHPDSGGLEERRASGRSFYGCPDPQGHGLPPVPERPTSWQIFLRAHWVAIGSAAQWDNTGLGRAGRLVFWPAASRPPAAFCCSTATAAIVAAIARAALHVVSRLSCVSAKVSKQTSDSLFRSQ